MLGPPAPGACGDSYTVARHDTLYGIARRCGLPVGAIARANRIHPTRIAAGQRLILAGRHRRADRPHEGEAAQTYSFRSDDTLYSLARWSRVSLRALLAANPGIDPHRIEIGDRICLPRGAVRPEAARLRERGPDGAPPAPPAVYVAPPPLPPHAGPPHHHAPPPPRADPRHEDGDEDKPGAGPESGPEDEEPEGL